MEGGEKGRGRGRGRGPPCTLPRGWRSAGSFCWCPGSARRLGCRSEGQAKSSCVTPRQWLLRHPTCLDVTVVEYGKQLVLLCRDHLSCGTSKQLIGHSSTTSIPPPPLTPCPFDLVLAGAIRTKRSMNLNPVSILVPLKCLAATVTQHHFNSSHTGREGKSGNCHDSRGRGGTGDRGRGHTHTRTNNTD